MEARKGNLYLYFGAALLIAAAMQLIDSLALLEEVSSVPSATAAQSPATLCHTASSCGRISFN